MRPRPSVPPLPLTHLGSLTVGAFMRRYWQKRPVLLRQAIDGFSPPVDRARLFELAADDAVESRLITATKGRWRLTPGPFGRADLPPRSRHKWTLLVQGVDQHDADAHALLARFRFLPDARLDDLMVSFATDGGGVGPHVDSYDVFLIQTHGRRRWRIGRQRDLALLPDLPLKILASFRPTREWALEPGDVLYLPPGVAHEGVAIGECVTCSVGFRAPRWQELVSPWFERLEERTQVPGTLRDPELRPTRAPARLPRSMIEAAFDKLARARPIRADAEAMLLRTLAEPKANVAFRSPRRPLAPALFEAAACRLGITLDLRTRVLYSRRRFAVNGELHALPAGSARVKRLADRRALSGSEVEALDPGQLALIHEWYVAGWLHVTDE